jgi:hypothetical protein
MADGFEACISAASLTRRIGGILAQIIWKAPGLMIDDPILFVHDIEYFFVHAALRPPPPGYPMASFITSKLQGADVTIRAPAASIRRRAGRRPAGEEPAGNIGANTRNFVLLTPFPLASI